jgi:sulfur relay (sulfurtransferase) complex TusBCD TusD component (DsrE family)
MKALFILNDPPYGTERSFNGLRLAKALQGKGAEVTLFLMAERWPAPRPARRSRRATTTSS